MYLCLNLAGIMLSTDRAWLLSLAVEEGWKYGRSVDEAWLHAYAAGMAAVNCKEDSLSNDGTRIK